MRSSAADRELVRRIRGGEEAAWRQCIAEYEGRLQAFALSRLNDRALAEDLVQETFLGFLTSLPNYDEATPLESFLFAITAHKITDTLRRQGRRPVLPLNAPDGSSPAPDPAGRSRVASSLARSREQHAREESVIADCLKSLIQQWMERGEFQRLKCMELLFVLGQSNQDTARTLGISEQEVANHKYYTVSRLKEAARKASLPEAEFDQFGLTAD